MRFGLDVAQQRMPWDEIVRRVRLAEDLGFDGAWGFDHLQPMYGDGPGETFEGMAPILESVHKTSRLLIAHEAALPFGIGAEIAATVAREGFWDLDAPIERIGAVATPPPYAPDLERAWLPDRDDIADALRRLVKI